MKAYLCLIAAGAVLCGAGVVGFSKGRDIVLDGSGLIGNPAARQKLLSEVNTTKQKIAELRAAGAAQFGYQQAVERRNGLLRHVTEMINADRDISGVASNGGVSDRIEIEVTGQPVMLLKFINRVESQLTEAQVLSVVITNDQNNFGSASIQMTLWPIPTPDMKGGAK